MTIDAILLYGSKARGDHDRFSDTDLLAISDGPDINKPFDQLGTSLHIYPRQWLENQSKDGSLFLLHIVTEAVPMFDPNEILKNIQSVFKYKSNYNTDWEIGLRVVAAILALNEDEFSPIMCKRYFWGLRTALMAYAANLQSPTFSARVLERTCGIAGVGLHIQTRADATPAECQRFGRQVIEKMGFARLVADETEKSENLRYLFDFGGVGTATAAEIIYSFRPLPLGK